MERTARTGQREGSGRGERRIHARGVVEKDPANERAPTAGAGAGIHEEPPRIVAGEGVAASRRRGIAGSYCGELLPDH